MPSDPFTDYGERQPWVRRLAWEAHYRAKGCSDTKASEVAARKMRGSTWPIGTKAGFAS